MSNLKLGIIGYGGFGRFLHHAWDAMPGVEVAAVSDADPGRRPQGPAFFDRWEDLVERADVDLVCIATPPNTHADIACVSMATGKHILIEKPLALSLADAERIVSVQKRTGRVAAVNFMLRFNPIVEAMHAWSRSGSFGRLRRVLVENYAGDDQLSPDHWFWDRERSGGILVEHAVHFIDIVAGCTESEPVRIDGLALSRDDGRRDRMGLTVLYGDGLVASQYHAFSRPGFFEQTNMRFVFDLAQVDVNGWIPLAGNVAALVNDETEQELKRLPGFAVTRRVPISNAADVSRPEGWGRAPDTAGRREVRSGGRGWGKAQAAAGPREVQPGDRSWGKAPAAAGPREVRSGGDPYEVETDVAGTFAMPVGKSEAYSDALRAHLADVRHAMADPAHRLRVSLADSVAGLAIALQATRGADAT